MKTYIINKGERMPLTKEIRFEAASHERKDGYVQFLDDDGNVIKEIHADLAKTIDIEN